MMIPIQPGLSNPSGELGITPGSASQEKVGSRASPAVPWLTHCWDTPWEKSELELNFLSHQVRP